MKSIGGFFELEFGKFESKKEDSIYLNSGRNAIRYLIRALDIKKIHVPSFTCSAVYEAIKKEKCDLEFYDIGQDLLPKEVLPKEDYIIYNNYFGVTGNKVLQMAGKYPKLIVDNAQAFYAISSGRASIYSLRKFFGVPDGGILTGKEIPALQLRKATSYNNVKHLCKRHDKGAEAAYKDYLKNEEKIDKYPLAYCSNLTEAILSNIDLEAVKIKRLENFNYLLRYLSTNFPIEMTEGDVPMVFPLLNNQGEKLRKKLIENRIYCAQYWPNIMECSHKDSYEYYMAQNLVALPIDQRYNLEDMDRIIRTLK